MMAANQACLDDGHVSLTADSAISTPLLYIYRYNAKIDATVNIDDGRRHGARGVPFIAIAAISGSHVAGRALIRPQQHPAREIGLTKWWESNVAVHQRGRDAGRRRRQPRREKTFK
ncbi:hypothetical protein [Sphingomonas sanxanigenens]|uniref:hypothetical protein n=1 Tax=Sphingomonas sanxanigenens TaxID=397260 RepID=UPI001300CADC|nr:hypothetical protein [Sphingomonas sanxanigenens]